MLFQDFTFLSHMVAHILQWQHSCSLGLLWVRISAFVLDFFFKFYFEMWDMLFPAHQKFWMFNFCQWSTWNLAPGRSLKGEVKGCFHRVFLALGISQSLFFLLFLGSTTPLPIRGHGRDLWSSLCPLLGKAAWVIPPDNLLWNQFK